ncbi:Uncharacterised protein [Serratia entomophila]|nr:Uncharacterised protein [Serratia entomophila]CAI1683188.1 Uncharacterised protein [Serratia entomophila]CAI1742153.1 Uncharacterised protein [Serratia entomophila]CAI1760208.1 Uncharacterised protein [Serratia entomophila]CAI1828118.1 Uncharacterised protein [Serratia entomophila]
MGVRFPSILAYSGTFYLGEHLHEQSVLNLKLLGAVRLLRLLKQSKQLHIIKQIAFFIFANTLN